MSEFAEAGYGFWSAVVVNMIFFGAFAVSTFRPSSGRDWRTLGAFFAFLLALFTEMYGFPLTLYLLWSWIGNRFPALDPGSHNSGHVWPALFGFSGDPHLSAFHLISNILIFGGFVLISASWKVLYRASTSQTLAVTGPYKVVRHPQYLGFIVIMTGFLVQWPTLATLLLFPVLVSMYARLAKREEKAMLDEFGEVYSQYADSTPALIPRFNLYRKRDLAN